MALLGILKAGGAYVPLDPATRPSAWPSCSRTTPGATLVLSPSSPEACRSCRHERAALWSVDDADDLAGDAQPAPGMPMPAREAAYVIYTSGSTGRPKGVAVDASGLVNRLRATCRRALDLRARGPRVHRTPTLRRSRDRRALPTLCSGGTAGWSGVTTTPDRGPPDLRPGHCVDRRDHHVHFVALDARSCSSTIPARRRARACGGSSCGGEACPRTLQDRVLRAPPGAPAPQPLRPDRGGRGRAPGAGRDPASEPPLVPIGKPIANTQCYVLDEALRAGAGRRPRASSASAGSGWPAATSTGPSSPPSASCPTRSRRAPGRACTAPATCAVPARRQHRVPRPHRPSGQDPRLPGRAGRDRGGAAPASGRAGTRGHRPRRDRHGTGSWWPTSSPALAADGRPTGRAACSAWREAARVHGARGSSCCSSAAADAQRQGGPPGAAGAGAASRERKRSYAPRARRSRSAWPVSGRRCSESSASASTTTSSTWAGTRCWPPGWSRTCATR